MNPSVQPTNGYSISKARGISSYNCRRPEQGQAIVEFALVMPILILLLMGVVFFAMAFNLQMVLNSAAREGARAWASNRADTSPCLITDTSLADFYYCDPTGANTGFNKTVVPLVRKYMDDNGYDGVKVVFEKAQVTKRDLSPQEWSQLTDSIEDATKVKLIIYYSITLPTMGLKFAPITLRAIYTFKRGS